MTYCEAIQDILSKGEIPESFLQPEKRNDFFVSSARKRIWAVELDLLFEIERVCKKHNLTYYLGYGSMLGAVRHGGYVPWDDDIDVFMPRCDYEKLELLSSEFSAPYSLQTPKTDAGSAYSSIKIRNCNTTGVAWLFRFADFNQGLWASVFPLDGAVEEGLQARYKKILDLNRTNSTYMRKDNPYLDAISKERVCKYDGSLPADNYDEIHRIAKQFQGEESERIASAVCTVYSAQRNLFYSEDFSESIMMPFEGFEFPVPKGYDRTLRIMYGDYSVFPPTSRRGLHHGGGILSADIGYRRCEEQSRIDCELQDWIDNSGLEIL